MFLQHLNSFLHQNIKLININCAYFIIKDDVSFPQMCQLLLISFPSKVAFEINQSERFYSSWK